MLKKIKKGFTLTELIIVIVIIGILAAVLIPSISGYVKKAKISKGVQEAKEMNTILAAEAVYQDKESFEPNEIRQLLAESNFKLESKLEDYRFWYDPTVNQMKYLSMEESFTGVQAANKTFGQDCIEALSSAHPEYRYMDTYNDELTQIVDTVNNLVATALAQNSITDSNALMAEDAAATRDAVLKAMDDLVGSVSTAVSKAKIKGLKDDVKKSITNYVSTFDTYNSVYVDDNIMYNRAYFAADTTALNTLVEQKSNINYNSNGLALDVAHMVFKPGITSVPACKTVVDMTFEVTVTASVTIPSSVTTIRNGSFTNITYAPSIVVNDTMIIDNDALSEEAKTALSTVGTNANFVTLYLGTDFEVNYYSAEAKLNNGMVASYVKDDNDTNPIKLNTLVYADGNLIYDETGEKVDGSLSRYLIPSVKFKNNKIDFSKITKFIIRRSLFNNICTYTGILIDEDLNSYKIESFGYITDIDWNIEQNFMSKNDQGITVVGADEATVKVYLPSYVYNFTNFKGAKMEVTLLPQFIKTREESSLTGMVEVYDGLAISTEPIVFYIEDGVYDPTIGMYVYEKKVENLNQYTLTVDGVEGTQCNQLSINKISVYTGEVQYDPETNQPITDDLNYLFIRNYK